MRIKSIIKYLLIFFLPVSVCWAGQLNVKAIPGEDTFTQDAPFECEKVVFHQEDYGYSIKAEYPRVIDDRFSAEEQKRINKLINDFVHKIFDDEIKGFVKDSAKIKTELEFSTDDSIDVTYKVVRFDNKYLSIKFDTYSYGMGAAHGLPSTESFNYDFRAKKLVKLKDIFKPNVNYLQQLSSYSISDLFKQLKTKNDFVDEEWIKDGAAAKKENFEQFGIGQDELIMYFGVYQVACYAAGGQEVRIPFTKLSGLQ